MPFVSDSTKQQQNLECVAYGSRGLCQSQRWRQMIDWTYGPSSLFVCSPTPLFILINRGLVWCWQIWCGNFQCTTHSFHVISCSLLREFVHIRFLILFLLWTNRIRPSRPFLKKSVFVVLKVSILFPFQNKKNISTYSEKNGFRNSLCL